MHMEQVYGSVHLDSTPVFKIVAVTLISVSLKVYERFLSERYVMGAVD